MHRKFLPEIPYLYQSDTGRTRLFRRAPQPKERIMFKRLFSAAVIFGAAAMAPPVQAQSQSCMPRTALIESLKNRYDENLTGGGL
ncbi:hypothetical protein [Thalassovita aquimarina]|uniref:hypothetical protein n=1 Tax=Thalassovita aquimarina TaxID=2785917 RepID=UPI003562A280